MKNLKIIYKETYKVEKTFVEEINLKSSDQWKALIEKARINLMDDNYILDLLPEEPSGNPDDWLFLFKSLTAVDYSKQSHAFLDHKDKDYCAQEWSIENQKGEVLATDYYSE